MLRQTRHNFEAVQTVCQQQHNASLTRSVSTASSDCQTAAKLLQRILPCQCTAIFLPMCKRRQLNCTARCSIRPKPNVDTAATKQAPTGAPAAKYCTYSSLCWHHLAAWYAQRAVAALIQQQGIPATMLHRSSCRRFVKRACSSNHTTIHTLVKPL